MKEEEQHQDDPMTGGFQFWQTEDITERKAPRKVSYHVDAENESLGGTVRTGGLVRLDGSWGGVEY